MKPNLHARQAFTLAELLTGMGILVVMFSFLIMATNQMVRAMGNTTGKIEQFRGARDAFERVTTRLSQATLNAYWDYKYLNNVPTYYERRSELRFLNTNAKDLLAGASAPQKFTQCVFFNAPLGYTETQNFYGLENLMNTWGFYVEYSQDTLYRPKFIGTEVPAKWRWKLMEFSQPTETFSVYKNTSGGTTTNPNAEKLGTQWIYDNNATIFQKSVRPVVENVIALVLIPRLSRSEEDLRTDRVNVDHSVLAPKYIYDTTTTLTSDATLNPKNQLPPVVQTTMVAIDERSAGRLSLDGTTTDLFGVQSKFGDTKNFTADLTDLEKKLVDKRVSYRIFTTNVHVRGAKWSREQADTSTVTNP
jgi:uncharacterized protein (TIGR02599 family)